MSAQAYESSAIATAEKQVLDVVALMAATSLTSKKEEEAPKEEKKDIKEETKDVKEEDKAPAKELSFAEKAEKFYAATAAIDEKFKTTKFGGGTLLPNGWSKSSTYSQQNMAGVSRMRAYVGELLAISKGEGSGNKAPAVETLGRKVFLEKYVSGLFAAEIPQTLIELQKLFNSLPEPLQRLLDKIREDDGDCTCKTGSCTAHVYQVPSGFNPKKPLGMAELHIIFKMVPLAMQCFLWALNRPDGDEDLTVEAYNSMKADDPNANWHGSSLDEFGYDAHFDNVVKWHHFIAGDSKMPSMAVRIEEIFKEACAASKKAVAEYKLARAKEAAKRPSIRHAVPELGF